MNLTSHLLAFALALSSTSLTTASLLSPTPFPTPTTSINNLPRAETSNEVFTTQSPSPTPSPTHLPSGTFYITSHITITGFSNPHVTVPDRTIDLVLPTCYQTIAPDQNGYLPPGTCGALYKYYPSFPAALVATIIFAVLTGLHIWKAVTSRKSWCWVICMASAWEFFGFLFRTISTRFQNVMGVYLVMQVFVLLAPLWINAFVYVVLGRLIYTYTPTHSLLGIPALVFSAMFVTLDIVAFVVQFVGGTMAGPMAPPEEQLRAIHIYMGGIGMQQFFIVVFVGLAIVFQRKVTKQEKEGMRVGVTGVAGTVDMRKGSGKDPLGSWKGLVYALYFALSMITLRIVYRFVEMSSGNPTNPLTTNEAYLYVLEALPMALALAVFVVVHPSKALSGPEGAMPGFFQALWGRITGCCGGKGRKKVKLGNVGHEPGLARRGTYEKIGDVEGGRV